MSREGLNDKMPTRKELLDGQGENVPRLPNANSPTGWVETAYMWDCLADGECEGCAQHGLLLEGPVPAGVDHGFTPLQRVVTASRWSPFKMQTPEPPNPMYAKIHDLGRRPI